MKHIGLVVLLMLAGCKKKESSGAGAGTASAQPPAAADAATAVAAIDAAAAPDATTAAVAAPPLAFNDMGLGPLALKVADDSDDGIKKHIEDALKPYPDLKVDFDVMDLGGEVEAEEGYFSIKKGDKEVAQIMRPSFTESKTKEVEIHALDPMFSTKDGIKPGDKAQALEKISDLKCVVKANNRLGFLTCTSAADPKLVYVINAENWKGKASKKGDPVPLAKLADRAIVEIVR